MMTKIKALFMRFWRWVRPGMKVLPSNFLRVPLPGDAVWWGKKGVEGVITVTGVDTIMFESGGPCKTKGSNAWVKHRYTTVTPFSNATWDEGVKCWLIGKWGKPPKNTQGKIITPDPVVMTLASK